VDKENADMEAGKRRSATGKSSLPTRSSKTATSVANATFNKRTSMYTTGAKSLVPRPVSRTSPAKTRTHKGIGGDNEESLGILSPTDMRSGLPSLSASVNSSCGWTADPSSTRVLDRGNGDDEGDESLCATITEPCSSSSGVSSMRSRHSALDASHSTPMRERGQKGGKGRGGTPAPTHSASPIRKFRLDSEKLRQIEALTETPQAKDQTKVVHSAAAISKARYSSSSAAGDVFAARTESLLRSSRPSSAGKEGRRRGVDCSLVARRLQGLRDKVGGSMDGTFTREAIDATFVAKKVSESGEETFVVQDDIKIEEEPMANDDEPGPDPNLDRALNVTYSPRNEQQIAKENQHNNNSSNDVTFNCDGNLTKTIKNNNTASETMMNVSSASSRALVDSCCTDTGLGSSMPSSMVLSMGTSQEMDNAGVFGPCEPPPATAKLPQVSPIEEKEERMELDEEGKWRLSGNCHLL